MESPKTKSRIWKSVLLVFFISLILLIGGLLFIAHDIPPIDDSDFALPARKIDPNQNPFPEVRGLEIDEDRLGDIRRVSKMYKGWEPMDDVFVDTIFQEFSEKLASFDRCAAMKDWKVDGKISLGTIGPSFVWISYLKESEIRQELDRGNVESALRKTFLLMKFGNGMQNSDGTLIQQITGVGMMQRGHHQLLEMIDKKKLNLEVMNEVMAELNGIEVSINGLINALRVEYLVIKPQIENLGDSKINFNQLWGYITSTGDNRRRPNPCSFKVNRTKQLIAETYRDYITELQLFRKDAQNVAGKRIERVNLSKGALKFSANAVGRDLFVACVSGADGIVDGHAHFRTRHQLIRLRIAMERFRLSKGNWPSSLKALVPEFIKAIPIDPMDGEPLRYNRDTLKIYSVGLDFVDDKGVADISGQLKDKNEIVIELEPKSKPEKTTL